MEKWKPVKGYEGFYVVSNNGIIKSLDMKLTYSRHGKKTFRIRKGKILTPVKTKNGYLRVEMSKNGEHKLNLVHRIVAQAFLTNNNNYNEINHINCDKTDNRVENLEWCNSSQNKIHALEHSLYKTEKPILQIKDGVVIKEYKSVSDCARQTGYCQQFIGKVALGKRKKAYGYQWKYKEKGC